MDGFTQIRLIILAIFSSFMMSLYSCSNQSTLPQLDLEEYQLVFEDHFEGSKLDSTKWQTHTTNPPPYDRVFPRASCDYSTSEYMSPNNVVIEDGKLCLIVKKQPFVYSGVAGGELGTDIGCDLSGGDDFKLQLPFTSGSITALKGYNHGYFECRAKISRSNGLYPVFWLWHHDEIVVFEYFGNPSEHHVSLHNKEKYSTEKFNLFDSYANDYHTYAVEWTPYRVTWFLESNPIKTEYKFNHQHRDEPIVSLDGIQKEDIVQNETFPDSQERWLRPNLSLRVFEWSEELDQISLPDTFRIDYLKIYQKNEAI